MRKLPAGKEHQMQTRNFIKSVSGIPTYIGYFLLINKYTINNFFIVMMLALCVMLFYHYLYGYLFPKSGIIGKKNRLALFIVIQAMFWFCIIVFFSKPFGLVNTKNGKPFVMPSA